MKRTLALCAIAAMFVVGAVAAQAAVTVNDKQTVPFAMFNPCANGGAGEIVSGTLNQHTLMSFTINDNNVSGTVHFQNQGADFTGSVTGDKYNPVGVFQVNFKDSLQNGQFTETFVNPFRLIGPGPGNDILVHQVSHITINANGDVTVNHNITGIECK